MAVLKPINWEQVKELCRCHCTIEEIAAVMQMNNPNQLYLRCKKDNGIGFAAFYRQAAGELMKSIRKTEIAAALGHRFKRTVVSKRKITRPDGTKLEEPVAIEVEEYIPPNPLLLARLADKYLDYGAPGAEALTPPGGILTKREQKVTIEVKYVPNQPQIEYDAEPNDLEHNAVPSEGAE